MTSTTQPKGPARPETAPQPDLLDLGDGGDWAPPANLSAPPPRPGMTQRWIRTGIQGDEDRTNIAKALSEGWKPRHPETVPEGLIQPTIEHGRFAGAIGTHNMVLMEMPTARVNQRKAYYDAKTQRMNEAVENDLLKDEDQRMPITQQRTLTASRGRRPRFADD
jgi:hypothetical protein